MNLKQHIERVNESHSMAPEVARKIQNKVIWYTDTIEELLNEAEWPHTRSYYFKKITVSVGEFKFETDVALYRISTVHPVTNKEGYFEILEDRVKWVVKEQCIKLLIFTNDSEKLSTSRTNLENWLIRTFS